MPILVIIHGESFSWGSGNIYDGTVMAAVGRVIVVTFNYRLGILGELVIVVGERGVRLVG